MGDEVTRQMREARQAKEDERTQESELQQLRQKVIQLERKLAVAEKTAKPELPYNAHCTLENLILSAIVEVYQQLAEHERRTKKTDYRTHAEYVLAGRMLRKQLCHLQVAYGRLVSQEAAAEWANSKKEWEKWEQLTD